MASSRKLRTEYCNTNADLYLPQVGEIQLMTNVQNNLTVDNTGWSLCFVHLNFIKYSTDRFSNLFHCQNQQNICNNTVTKDSTKCVATLPCEMSVS